MADWSGAEAYARSFARLCAGAVGPLLDLVAERSPTGTLLDVGSGTGTLALAAVARGRDVVAVEPEPAMRALARRAGLEPVDGALPDLPFADGRFEAVAANLVVNHLADPRAGVAGLARVTASGGTVAVSIWGSAPGALSTVWRRVLEGSGVAPLPGVRLPPERDFARTEEGLSALLAGAGLERVRSATAASVFEVGPDDLWAAVEAGIGVIGATWRAQDDAVRARMREAFAAVAGEGVLRLPAEALLAVASRP